MTLKIYFVQTNSKVISMKKIVTTILFICLAINSYNAFNMENCKKEIQFNNLNSKNILSYLKENELTNKIIKICSNDLCSDVSIGSIEQDIKEFIKRNLDYLNAKDKDTSLEAELKGFRIDKILINSCL